MNSNFLKAVEAEGKGMKKKERKQAARINIQLLTTEEEDLYHYFKILAATKRTTLKKVVLDGLMRIRAESERRSQ